MPTDADLALKSRAWPFQEAEKLLRRLEKRPPGKGPVVLETGYGPSGLPHIGTFGEVVRTTMVRRAFETLCDLPTRLIAFSDDLDGLRKVPDNVPEQEMLREHVQRDLPDGSSLGGVPLTSVPDPFGTHESFAHHNNARLIAFLDEFGFDYEFVSSTECYRSGQFDATLLRVLERYDEVMSIVLPELRAQRRETYCPFLPLSPKSGRVLHSPAEEIKPGDGTIVFRDEDGERFEAPVTGGHCKLQWRVDWAMRWAALGVDYEMSGKDLIDSVRLSGRICRLLGATPPEGFTYELFLDERGEKISKSKGNGLSLEEWLRYASRQSLSYYMYQSPRRAKRLYFDVIPRAVDDYLAALKRYRGEDAAPRFANPVWHVHRSEVPEEEVPLGFAVLLNLAGTCNTEDESVLWGFISRYVPGATPENHPILDQMVGYALVYYRDFVKPGKRYRAADENERAALEDLAATLEGLAPESSAEEIQTEVYEVGKRHDFAELKLWFRALYEVLFGDSRGPRMGSFIALYGLPETVALIRRALAGEDLSKA